MRWPWNRAQAPKCVVCSLMSFWDIPAEFQALATERAQEVALELFREWSARCEVHA